jgi:hypothetical protein
MDKVVAHSPDLSRRVAYTVKYSSYNRKGLKNVRVCSESTIVTKTLQKHRKKGKQERCNE